ncbi:Uncharacterised protein [uncultured Clostridium sp.]|nr:Uncharacterised protein [uncultured Clostridium sp.]
MQNYKTIPKFNVDGKLGSAKWFSEYTGIGINNTYSLLNRVDAPVIKVGRKIFVIKAKVDEWLETLIGETV